MSEIILIYTRPKLVPTTLVFGSPFLQPWAYTQLQAGKWISRGGLAPRTVIVIIIVVVPQISN